MANRCVTCGCVLSKGGYCVNNACDMTHNEKMEMLEKQDIARAIDLFKVEEKEAALIEPCLANDHSNDTVNAAAFSFTYPRRKENVLEEADKLTSGDRNKDYGSAKEDFSRAAKMWSEVIGKPVTPMQVVLCMVLLKVSRQTYKHKRDNLVDIAGYARVAEMLEP